MAWNFCLICQDLKQLKQGFGYLCDSCVSRISELTAWYTLDVQQPPFTLHYLYDYLDPLRQIVLNCKVNSHLTSYRYLIELYTSHPQTQFLAAQCDYIIPAPSSLWGRIRGRFDLAYGAAAALAKAHQTPLQRPPLELAWRTKKRARERHKIWTETLLQPQFAAKNRWWEGRRLLLLDDIVTSGLTMATLANFYPGATIRALCLAGSTKSSHLDQREPKQHDTDATSVL